MFNIYSFSSAVTKLLLSAFLAGGEGEVIEENGYKVLRDNDPNTTTIKAVVLSEDSEYLYLNNYYDESDHLALANDGTYKLDDVVYVTFEGEDVVEVNKSNPFQ